MRTVTKHILLVALTLTAGTAALITTTNAAGQTGPSVMRLIVPLSYVHFHATGVGPKGISPGDGFQESWLPSHPAAASRQDAIAIATFRQAVFLGTITLNDGQLVYAGSTNNQDNAVYAIIGGTGRYQGARGTMNTHSLPRARLQITITTDGS
jgi:hypothetical protein